MILDFFIPFISIILAEFGDKTQIAIISISSKTKKKFQILFGAILAFAIIDGLAILFGNYISDLIPLLYIKIIAGTLFIFFGILTILEKTNSEDNNKNKIKEIKNPLIYSFLLLSLAELGDKSQFVAGTFSSIYNPILTFFGIICGVIIISSIAILLGDYINKKFNKNIVKKISAGLFFTIGISILISII